MTVDQDDQTYILLSDRIDRLSRWANELSSPSRVWDYWWEVFFCFVTLPALQHRSLPEILDLSTRYVLAELSATAFHGDPPS